MDVVISVKLFDMFVVKMLLELLLGVKLFEEKDIFIEDGKWIIMIYGGEKLFILI